VLSNVHGNKGICFEESVSACVEMSDANDSQDLNDSRATHVMRLEAASNSRQIGVKQFQA
jgi:hypothetical protein